MKTVSPAGGKFRAILHAAFALPVLLLAVLNSTAQDDTLPPGPLTCAVCGKTPMVGQIWKYRESLFCDDCHKLPARCAHCGLPVKDGFVKTSDGRHYCKTDHPRLVFATNEATRVFTEVGDTIARLTRNTMALRQPVVTVSLFDVDYWNPKDAPPELRRQGFSTTRRTGGDFSHTVVLLSGQPRDDFRSVCAHEYVHLWINENRAADRKLDLDTLEAICELIPYKLSEITRDTNQMHRIRVNPYTRGVITNLIAFEAHHGLDAVLALVKGGKTEKLDTEGLAAASPPRWAATGAPAELPADVALTGLAGSTGRRLAFINGQLMRAGDRKRIALKGRTVSVRCLEVQEDHAVVQVDDEPRPRTLKLGGR
jgi:hypothetical protein